MDFTCDGKTPDLKLLEPWQNKTSEKPLPILDTLQKNNKK